MREEADPQAIERLQWILYFAEHGSVSGTCAHFTISRSTFYRWLKRFDPADYSTLTDHPTRPAVEQVLPRSEVRGPQSASHCPLCRLTHWLRAPSLRSVTTLVLVAVMLNIALLLLVLPVAAGAASSWNPTLLVNTEAFQTIDDDDTEADVVLRFGDTLQKTLTYERGAQRFNFNDDVNVQGTASGTHIHAENRLTASGTFVITANGVGQSSASEGPNSPSSVVSDPTIGSGLNPSWVNPQNATASDGDVAHTGTDYGETEYAIKLIVGGSVSGDNKSTSATPPFPEAYVSYGGASDTWGLTLSASNVNASNFGVAMAFEGSEGISEYLWATNFGFSIPVGATIDGVLVEAEELINGGELWTEIDHIRITVYYTVTTGEKKTITASGGKLGIGTATPETDLEVVGTASGQWLHGQSKMTSSGTLAVEGAAAFGSTIKLGGVTYTFPASDGTASGKVLKTDSAGVLSWSDDESGEGSSGLSAADAEGMFVNQGGDTMTGALTISNEGAEPSLDVKGTMSGKHLYITGTGSLSDVIIPSMSLGDSPYKSVNDFFNLFTSAGRISGGNIADAGSQTITIASGTGVIRVADDDVSQIKFFEWNSSGATIIPTNTIRYIGVSYNAGSPKVVMKTANTWDYDTEFPLGSVINQEDDLYILNNPWWVSDGLTNVIERLQADGYTIRDQHVGGLILGVTGTRNPTLTAGTVWSRLNEFNITAKDCSGTDTFYAFYRNGAGGYTRTESLSQYPVTQYDDGDGGLANLSNNWYANWWVFVEVDETNAGKLMLIYPQNQYSNAAAAEAEEVPTFPSFWYEHGLLVGRILIKQGTDAPVETQSAFVTQFTPAQASDHGNLAGLTDDDHSQYLLLTGRSGQRVDDSVEFTGTASGRILSFGERLTGSGHVTIRTLTDSITAFQVLDSDGGTPVFNIDTTNERVGIGTASPENPLEVIGTISGSIIRASTSLTSSGVLAIEGAAAFGSTIKLGGVTYTFPASDGTASGKVLKTDSAGVLSWSDDESGEGSSGLSAADAEGMFVNQGGDTMTGALTISNGAGLNASGAILTNSNLTINSDNGATDAVLTFGNDAGAETLKFNDTTNQFELSDDLAVTGKLSASDTISGSGTLAIEGNAALGGTVKLNGVTYTFPASDGTASGKVLKTNSAGVLSWSDDSDSGAGGGISAVTAEGMFVNQGGDTMTGALKVRANLSGSTLRVDGGADIWGSLGVSGTTILDGNVGVGTATPNVQLSVAGTASGTILSFGQRLTGSGSVSIRTLTDSITAFQIFKSSGTAPVFNVDTSNERVGIGTAAPETELEVVGTISGSSIKTSGNLSVSGSILTELNTGGGILYSNTGALATTAKGASGQVLVSQGTAAPSWFNLESAMVWYIDGDLVVKAGQGAVVTMPFGFTVSGVTGSVHGAPTGQAMIFDINKDGSTIFSTRPQINAGATSDSAGAVFSDTNLTVGSKITLDIDQVGSTFSGSGLTVILRGVKKF